MKKKKDSAKKAANPYSGGRPVPVRFPESTIKLVQEVAAATGRTQQHIIKQACELGLQDFSGDPGDEYAKSFMEHEELDFMFEVKDQLKMRAADALSLCARIGAYFLRRADYDLAYSVIAASQKDGETMYEEWQTRKAEEKAAFPGLKTGKIPQGLLISKGAERLLAGDDEQPTLL